MTLDKMQSSADLVKEKKKKKLPCGKVETVYIMY